MIGIYNRRSLKCSDTWVMGCNDVLAPSFQAQACLFLRLWEGWGSAKFASDEWSGGYLCIYRTLNF